MGSATKVVKLILGGTVRARRSRPARLVAPALSSPRSCRKSHRDADRGQVMRRLLEAALQDLVDLEAIARIGTRRCYGTVGL
jgi:ribonuclease PH